MSGQLTVAVSQASTPSQMIWHANPGGQSIVPLQFPPPLQSMTHTFEFVHPPLHADGH